MGPFRILITGDYGHADFQEVISDSPVATTLIPLTEVVSWDAESCDLIVMAQSRRGQISQVDVEMIRSQFPLVPIVNLMGSWCEGAERSGCALDGVKPVFWHQWKGRFEEFISQVQSGEMADWQLPATATHADRMESRHRRETLLEAASCDCRIGVYCMTMTQFEMLSDTFKAMGWQAFWMLQQDWDGQPIDPPDAICADGLSLTPILVEKVADLKERFPASPLIVTLNFPRHDEVEELRRMGVSEVVSKPFEHIDLQLAVSKALLESTEF